ncbi:TMEM175 family protein [Sphingomonas astaxanthinifaciens]|uniref:DUF1211 domain-containing protein n=1 Tax=Sphingomonas astaxanthinifaciens DSM 22298 TaxID=1123267 RepID=A0ABQ5Z4X9_9SPHN|nr:TMEM175 family protein [Sphingomonas astaxanthinifaciens]GLR47061.1 hypothetical protein GCM10007925_07720 [Sphingomonas astaxanthinifaciens DSM 22298]
MDATPSPLSPDAPLRRDSHEGEGATRGTARMEAFADGVFAIAFTLPVFNIVMPTLGGRGSDLGSDLLAGWPHHLGYLIASLIIALYWVHHHFSGAIYRTTGHSFLLATALFLTMIGYIAFPVRAFAESIPHPGALPDAARFLSVALALTSLSWLTKWSVGRHFGHVDDRLDPAYVDRLTRTYRRMSAWNVAAALIAWVDWRIGLAMSAAGLLAKLKPPETPRYCTEAPVIEGEA